MGRCCYFGLWKCFFNSCSMRDMPGIMSHMPPLNVYINEDLANSVLPNTSQVSSHENQLISLILCLCFICEACMLVAGHGRACKTLHAWEWQCECINDVHSIFPFFFKVYSVSCNLILKKHSSCSFLCDCLETCLKSLGLSHNSSAMSNTNVNPFIELFIYFLWFLDSLGTETGPVFFFV